jgi:hypothetical protein
MPKFKDLLDQAKEASGVLSPFVADVMLGPGRTPGMREEQLFSHWINDIYMLNIVTALPIHVIARDMQLRLSDLAVPKDPWTLRNGDDITVPLGHYPKDQEIEPEKEEAPLKRETSAEKARRLRRKAIERREA